MDWIQDNVGNYYQIIEKMGEGQSSNIYLIQDVLNKKKYVVKHFKEDGDLFHEKKILKKISNRGRLVLVNTISFPQSIVFEFNRGTSLNKVSTKNYPLVLQLKMFQDILIQLDSLHKKSIFHRDIKPENIIITPAKNFHLIDFGWAIIGNGDGVLAGTDIYISPLYYRGFRKGKESLEKNDVWCLGATALASFYPNLFKSALSQYTGLDDKARIVDARGHEYSIVKKEMETDDSPVLVAILACLGYSKIFTVRKIIDKAFLPLNIRKKGGVRTRDERNERDSLPMKDIGGSLNDNKLKKYKKNVTKNKDLKRQVYLSTIRGKIDDMKLIVPSTIQALVILGKYGKNVYMDDLLANDIFYMDFDKLQKKINQERKKFHDNKISSPFYHIYFPGAHAPNPMVKYIKNDPIKAEIGVWGLPLDRNVPIGAQKLFEPNHSFQTRLISYIHDFVNTFGKGGVLVMSFDMRMNQEILNIWEYALNRKNSNLIFPSSDKINKIKSRLKNSNGSMILSTIHGSGKDVSEFIKVPPQLSGIILIGKFNHLLTLDQVFKYNVFGMSKEEWKVEINSDRMLIPRKRFFHYYPTNTKIPNFKLEYRGGGHQNKVDYFTGIWIIPLKRASVNNVPKQRLFTVPPFPYNTTLDFYISEFVRRFGGGYTLVLGFCKAEMSKILDKWESYQKNLMDVEVEL